MKLTIPDPQEKYIEDIAQRLNLRRIGWIFTDLIPDESKPGTGAVLHHRGNVVS